MPKRNVRKAKLSRLERAGLGSNAPAPSQLPEISSSSSRSPTPTTLVPATALDSHSGSSAGENVTRGFFQCRYHTAAHMGTYRYRCSSAAELNQHRATHHPYIIFPFFKLPPEVRNNMYECLVREVDFGHRVYDAELKRPLLTGPIFRNAALNLFMASRLCYQEAVMWMSHRVGFQVSGLDHADIRAIAKKPGLPRITRSQGLSDDAAKAATARCSILSKLDEAKRWGYNTAVLKFDNRMVKWVKNWEINLDFDQWDGDILFPTTTITTRAATYPATLVLREPGCLSDTFKILAHFSRFYEKYGPIIDSIKIKAFRWQEEGASPRSQPLDPIFLSLHLVEVLSALLPVRGVKSVEYCEDIKDILTRGGQFNFLGELERAITSRPIHRGDMSIMMKNLEDFLCSFYPCYSDQGNSVFRTKSRCFIFHKSLRKNFRLLQSMVAERPCWASFGVLRDRIMYEALARFNTIITARANLGNDLDLSKLLILFNGFAGFHRHALYDFAAHQTTDNMYDWCSKIAEIISRSHPDNLINFLRLRRGIPGTMWWVDYVGRELIRNMDASRSSPGSLAAITRELVRDMDTVITRLRAKHALVHADIVACNRVSMIETPDDLRYVSERRRRVDEERSDVDRKLDALVGTTFNWKPDN